MNLRGHSVENSCNIGSWIVVLRTGRTFISAPYAKVSVAGRGQCFANFFLFCRKIGIRQIPSLIIDSFTEPLFNLFNRNLSEVTDNNISTLFFQF